MPENYVVRLISSKDHKIDKSELIKVIQLTGTDRYSSDKLQLFNDFYKKYGVDFFGTEVAGDQLDQEIDRLAQEFVQKSVNDRGEAVVPDIALIYHSNNCQMISNVYEGFKESDCFRFTTDPLQALYEVRKIMANLNISRAERLDMRVIAMYPDLTRSVAAKLIEQGKVTVNGKVIAKAGHKLKPGDDIVADYNYESMTAIPSIKIPILYEDNDCVVVDKPAGILTHSKGEFNPEATVASWLAEHMVKQGKKPLWLLEKDVESGSPNNPRAGIVHRLDRATSGVMICAKTPAALAFLQKQFSQRKTKKTYVAIVSGHLKPEHAIIDMPIERNPKHPKTFHVSAGGKHAITEYIVKQSSDKFDLVELKPITGRTHQLRVHLQHQGHPILGDTFYSAPSADRLYLHATTLEITLPNKDRKIFESKLPIQFRQIMQP